jgi:hypothetical protein
LDSKTFLVRLKKKIFQETISVEPLLSQEFKQVTPVPSPPAMLKHWGDYNFVILGTLHVSDLYATLFALKTTSR